MFDALLMKKKNELGLSLLNPTSLDDVPANQRSDFEKYYVDCARETGTLFLKSDQLSEAWVYFRTIQEPDAISEALETATLPEDYEKSQELINIALYEGANPVKGLQFLLQSNGTCNTITAMDQAMQGLEGEKPTEGGGDDRQPSLRRAGHDGEVGSRTPYAASAVGQRTDFA